MCPVYGLRGDVEPNVTQERKASKILFVQSYVVVLASSSYFRLCGSKIGNKNIEQPYQLKLAAPLSIRITEKNNYSLIVSISRDYSSMQRSNYSLIAFIMQSTTSCHPFLILILILSMMLSAIPTGHYSCEEGSDQARRLYRS